MKKYILTLVALVIVLIGAIAVKAAVSNNVTGWAWSSNIGWISFSSTDSNTGTNGSGTSPVAYNVTVDQNGNFGGYGWSSNVGWISFNASDLSGCDGSTPAVVSTSSGNVTGWVRVVAGKGRTDGWDGCVKLSEGTTGTIYPTGVFDGSRGVSYNTSTYEFKGYGWGSDVLGWIQFSPTLAGVPPVVCTNNCGTSNPTPSVNFTASPMSVSSGGTTVLTWSSNNVTSCTASGGWSGSKDISGNETSQSLTSNTSFTIQCSGPYGSTQPRTVTVTVNTTPTPTACIQPANSYQCPGYVDTPTRRLWNTASQCTPSPTSCEFYCYAGFTARGGACVIIDITEE